MKVCGGAQEVSTGWVFVMAACRLCACFALLFISRVRNYGRGKKLNVHEITYFCANWSGYISTFFFNTYNYCSIFVAVRMTARNFLCQSIAPHVNKGLSDYSRVPFVSVCLSVCLSVVSGLSSPRPYSKP